MGRKSWPRRLWDLAMSKDPVSPPGCRKVPRCEERTLIKGERARITGSPAEGKERTDANTFVVPKGGKHAASLSIKTCTVTPSVCIQDPTSGIIVDRRVAFGGKQRARKDFAWVHRAEERRRERG